MAPPAEHTADNMRAYVDLLCQEIAASQRLNTGGPLRSVFFGGGGAVGERALVALPGLRAGSAVFGAANAGWSCQHATCRGEALAATAPVPTLPHNPRCPNAGTPSLISLPLLEQILQALDAAFGIQARPGGWAGWQHRQSMGSVRGNMLRHPPTHWHHFLPYHRHCVTRLACFACAQTGAEISIEADPGTFDASRLRSYMGLGVNRVSVGVQVRAGSAARAGMGSDLSISSRCCFASSIAAAGVLSRAGCGALALLTTRGQ